jgi:hypothetical protein
MCVQCGCTRRGIALGLCVSIARLNSRMKPVHVSSRAFCSRGNGCGHSYREDYPASFSNEHSRLAACSLMGACGRVRE